MDKHNIAYFLTLTTPTHNAKMVLEVNKALEGICSLADMEVDGNTNIYQFDCDEYGGTVSKVDRDELIGIFQKLSSDYPEAVFQLYIEDEDDGKQNQTFIFQAGQYRQDSSILIDSSLLLIPQEPKQYTIDCMLDDCELVKVKCLLNCLGCEFTIR